MCSVKNLNRVIERGGKKVVGERYSISSDDIESNAIVVCYTPSQKTAAVNV